MKEIFIKYNPYKLETQILIDGHPVKENSSLNKGEERLQEWVEDLPQILVDECNSTEFKIVFNGTILDYEDMLAVAKDARKRDINIEYSHIPAKEVGDKEQAIDMLFNEIKNGPFEELRQPDIIRAFELARSSDFEVNVVATMSAGKSTLINALLRRKLMPAKQEACTATITKIKDIDSDIFRATVYDKSGDLLETHPELTLEIMNKLNNDPCVSVIEVEGDIPFVTPGDVALVLVDTPGPNNSRDPGHKVATYRMLSESSKTVVLYVLNATQLGVEDDSNLLDYVSKSMSVGGKQSKDRFLFIVNKLDDFRKDEDSVNSSIEKVKKYLEDKGILNPNIYPAAALPALNIRTLLKQEDMDEDLRDETEVKVRKINRNEMLYLENYAPLTPSIRGEVTAELAAAKESEDTYSEALIHTGIIPIELAIRMYVQKYAKTAKIKNIVDTFAKKLESAKSFENTKKEIAVNQDKQKEILTQINSIKAKLKSGEEAMQFRKQIDAINYDKEIVNLTKEVIKQAQSDVTTQIGKYSNKKLTPKEAESVVAVFSKFLDQLQAKLQITLEDAVTEHVEKNAKKLLTTYKNKIVALASEVNAGTVEVNPFELMDGDIGRIDDISGLLSSARESERVIVNERKIYKETIGLRRWLNRNIGTSFQVDYDMEYDYEDNEYIDGSKLAQKFFAKPQKQLFDFGDSAVKYAKEQSNQIKQAFNKKFIELDKVLTQKLEQLENCASNNRRIDAVIKKTQENLKWLENIQARVNDILEI
jgi:hypothetical protein